MADLTIKYTKSRTTRNYVVFHEDLPERQQVTTGDLYIHNDNMKDLGTDTEAIEVIVRKRPKEVASIG